MILAKSISNRFTVIILACLVLGQAVVSQEEAVDSINPATVTDGPYISWESDSTLAVSHICYGEHHQKSIDIDSVANIPDCCFETLPGGLSVSRESPGSDQYQFEGVSRVMAISDIHGEFEAMVRLLQSAEVVDSEFNWQWDDGHLVICGDVFDRGDMVARSLWFLYRLQKQALTAGGEVHYLLGNHELMVLRGDERYLHPKYTQITVPLLGQAHVDLVGPNTILGQWLRRRPTMILIDSILFLHGGISPDLVSTGLTIPQINDLARKWIDRPKPEVKADSTANLLYGRMGPFWYRGLTWSYAGYARQSSVELTDLLSYFGAKSVVVGHSEQDSLQGYYANQLFAIDVPVAELGGLQGLLHENNQFFRVDPDGTRTPIIADSSSVPKELDDSE